MPIKTQNEESTEIVQLNKQEYQHLQKLAQQGSQQSSTLKELIQNPEGLKQLKEAVKEVIESGATSWVKLQQGQFIYSLVRVGMVLLIIVVIIWSASSLTSSGRLDGSALTFLLGTITGYLLTFLTNIEGGRD